MNNEYKKLDNEVTIMYVNHKGETYECLIDTNDVDKVCLYNWHIRKGRNTLYVESRKHGKLHRFIMNPELGYVVDHIDGNGLNNTRKNLRNVTVSKNNANRNNKSEGKSSKYLNVYYDTQNNNWVSRVKISGKTIALGSYDLEWVAALVSMEYKKQVYGNDFVPEDIEKELVLLKEQYTEEYNQCIKDSEERKRFKGGIKKTGSSGIRGVQWRESRKKWMAHIRVNGKSIGLGQYSDKYEAGRAVTRATLKYLGEDYVIRTPIILD